MITCELNGKKYSVDFITGRALRDVGPVLEAHNKMILAAESVRKGALVQGIEGTNVADVYDTMIKWFCSLFKGQFTPDDVYDYYPSDRLMVDVQLALMAVMSGATEVLDSFPTKAAEGKRSIAT